MNGGGQRHSTDEHNQLHDEEEASTILITSPLMISSIKEVVMGIPRDFTSIMSSLN